jgi:hypothetical protein
MAGELSHPGAFLLSKGGGRDDTSVRIIILRAAS